MPSAKNKLFWVAILYFAEGFPFGLIIDAFPVYFRTHGVSLKEIGLLSLVGLPWTLKFLWAPAVDLLGRRRSWIRACQVLLGLSLLTVLSLPPGSVGIGLWLLMFSLALFSATQDIAIDAYTIELLDPDEMGEANGVRVTTYRIALIAAGGLFVAAAGMIGWDGAFIAASILLLAMALLSGRAPEVASNQNPRKRGGNEALPVLDAVWRPLKRFWERPGFFFVALFILLFKLGDMAMGPMVKPFWVDRNFTPVQIGMVPGTIGVVSTIAGALLGGALTSRWGIFKALWILGIAQAASNLFYAAAAAFPPSIPMMYGASVVESFSGGLGTAPFLAFLMSVCDKEHAATQYALLSALFGLTRSVSGAFSGMATEELGYVAYFTATFFLAWPAFVLLPWVRVWIPEKGTGDK
ncbi:MAG TPA: MFS transporter [Candidatus Manganitrophaceae bacterium]|nr:MFS transporter [Candidatus Manganitrophaceae bacterium]